MYQKGHTHGVDQQQQKIAGPTHRTFPQVKAPMMSDSVHPAAIIIPDFVWLLYCHTNRRRADVFSSETF